MIQICYYNGCGVVYGETKPLSDKSATHGLCPKHLEVSLKEIKAEMERVQWLKTDVNDARLHAGQKISQER
jgi:hypothetical protein